MFGHIWTYMDLRGHIWARIGPRWAHLGVIIFKSPELGSLRCHGDPNHALKRAFTKLKINIVVSGSHLSGIHEFP